MTDEEKAEEYAKSVIVFNRDFHSEKFFELEQAYLAGLKAGKDMNVSTKWHKVADGDYPDTNRTVLAYSDDVAGGNYPYLAQYWKGSTDAKKNDVDLNWTCWRNNMQRELVEPTIWCEIPTYDDKE